MQSLVDAVTWCVTTDEIQTARAKSESSSRKAAETPQALSETADETAKRVKAVIGQIYSIPL